MADGTDSVATRLVNGAVGAAVETAGLVGGGVSAVWNAGRQVMEVADAVTEPVRRPLDVLGVTDLVRRPVVAVVEGVEATASRLQETGEAVLGTTIGDTIDAVLLYLTDNPALERFVVRLVGRILPALTDEPALQAMVLQLVPRVLPALADDPALEATVVQLVPRVLPALADDPALEALVVQLVPKVLPALADDPALHGLVSAQVAKVLPQLADSEQVQALIRAQGDVYVDYLNAYPDSVQNLVAGQSVSLAGEVINEVRERTVTADSFVEMIVRNILRRKPREELPAPPEIVQRRAERARLPSDFTSNGGDNHAG